MGQNQRSFIERCSEGPFSEGSHFSLYLRFLVSLHSLFLSFSLSNSLLPLFLLSIPRSKVGSPCWRQKEREEKCCQLGGSVVLTVQIPSVVSPVFTGHFNTGPLRTHLETFLTRADPIWPHWCIYIYVCRQKSTVDRLKYYKPCCLKPNIYITTLHATLVSSGSLMWKLHHVCWAEVAWKENGCLFDATCLIQQKIATYISRYIIHCHTTIYCTGYSFDRLL